MQNKEAWFYKLMVGTYMKLDRAPQMQHFFSNKQFPGGLRILMLDVKLSDGF
jgi:hypothetical protein